MHSSRKRICKIINTSLHSRNIGSYIKRISFHKISFYVFVLSIIKIKIRNEIITVLMNLSKISHMHSFLHFYNLYHQQKQEPLVRRRQSLIHNFFELVRDVLITVCFYNILCGMLSLSFYRMHWFIQMIYYSGKRISRINNCKSFFLY